MSRLFQRLGFVAAMAIAVAAPAHAADFLKAIEDVPLPKGMVEQGEPVVFESEQGRVVKTVAEGAVPATMVTGFYIATLGSLGWNQSPSWVPKLVFLRENETLNITTEEKAGRTTASYELVVKLASTRLTE